MQSPYHPGTGARPDVLVGRDAVFSQAQALVERVRSTGRGGAAALDLGDIADQHRRAGLGADEVARLGLWWRRRPFRR